MTSISSIKASLSTTNTVHYADGDLTVTITLKDAPFDADYANELFCYIYAEDYYPMCNSRENSVLNYAWPTWSAVITSHHVWVPGKYTLYIFDNKGDIQVCTDMTVDKRLRVKVTNHKRCRFMGREDILTTCLESSKDNWQLMACRPGTGALRQEALEHTQLEVYNEMRKGLNAQKLRVSRNLLIETISPDDLDKDTLRRFCTLVGCGTLNMIDCSMLYNVTHNNPYEPLNDELLGISAPATLCLTNLNALHGTGGKVIVKHIIERIHDYPEGEMVLWLCGSRQEIDSVFDVFPSVKLFFTRQRRLQLRPYTVFEMVQAFYETIVNSGLQPSDEAKDVLVRAVMKGHANGTLSSWRLGDIRRFVADEVMPHYIHRTIACYGFEQPEPLETEDIDTDTRSGGCSAYEQSIRELNAMIGLDDIKHSITTMANRTKFYMERRRLGLPTSDKAVFHAIFTGNPGTGKTTVARMLGKIYRALGLLSRGDVIAVDRTRLVGRYIGETEENMKLLLEEARGNVLFIDEAYTLYDGAGDRKDFGCRVIDSLLTVLSQPNPDMLIIFAGYEKEMDSMLSTNPGLFGRFPYKYRFGDYDASQLMQIACHVLSQDQYLLTDDARALLLSSIENTLEQRTKNFGNARWVEQYVRNGIIPALADRVSALTGSKASTLYQTIEAVDVRTAYEKFNPKTIELRPRRQVGFSA